MPTRKKRIGYLPRKEVIDLIEEIAHQENISSSKVVGKLVEEALTARGLFSVDNIKKSEKSFKYSNNFEMDELVSDEGITYSNKDIKGEIMVDDNLKKMNPKLIKEFQDFLLFQEYRKKGML